MVNGVNNSNSISYWLSIINSQKSQTAASASQTLAGSPDSAQITSKLLNASGAAERVNPLAQLVTDGTLTQEQADAIDSVLRSGKPGDGNDNPLAGLIAEGTITQDQADSVKSTLDANRPKDFMSNILDNLVSDGTLTQEQADAVSSSLKEGAEGMRRMQGPPPPPPRGASASSGSSEEDETYSATELAGMTAEEILQLLSSGKITSQDAVTALKGGEDSDTQGVGSSTSQRAQQQDPLASLVTAGVISQDQEEAIKAAFRQGTDMNRAIKAYGVE